jgi:DNA-binding transcriptional regulator YiaG
LDADGLRKIRQTLSMTQTEFGTYLGGSPLRTIQDWESGKNKIPTTVVEILRLKGQL